ncbi:hypothetical protein M758_9G035500 [Ceratodon purpureus]|nr:hypothetical protein M758_9G035500 [Ceratodon purpureus]
MAASSPSSSTTKDSAFIHVQHCCPRSPSPRSNLVYTKPAVLHYVHSGSQGAAANSPMQCLLHYTVFIAFSINHQSICLAPCAHSSIKITPENTPSRATSINFWAKRLHSGHTPKRIDISARRYLKLSTN